jgi:hypothetical protein
MSDGTLAVLLAIVALLILVGWGRRQSRMYCRIPVRYGPRMLPCGEPLPCRIHDKTSAPEARRT